jgi:2-polyprenyl-3-methyl-5-hydroxy-6-metoxy-1,4-benzoquinol methylase
VAFLDPRPRPESIAGAYTNYYTHGDAGGWSVPASGPEPGRLVGVKVRLRNGYLAGRYGLPLAPAWRAARWVVPVLFPGRGLAFDTSVRHLPLPAPGARLLDVGCGSGAFLVYARTLGWSVMGLEIDGVAAARAAAAGLEVIGSPLEQAGLPASHFDAVTLNHVIEHLHDAAAALREVFRVLRPGGMLWVATPNLESPLLRRLGSAWRGLEPPRHLVLYHRRALGAALLAAGFSGLSWPRAYPITRWIHDASGGQVPAATLRLLALGSALSDRWSEQLVVLARKPVEGRP